MGFFDKELKTYKAELHVHTVLSPCASVEMIPPLIIQEAEKKGINLLGVTDHNAIENVSALLEAARGTDITILPGIELQTREEIHSICLFDTLEQLHNFYSGIFSTFPNIKNNANYFGEQYVVDSTGEFIRNEERLLITSSALSLKEAWNEVVGKGGLIIPAHVNRKTYGLLPVLGFVPKDIPLEILEISRHITTRQAQKNFPELKNFKLIHGGDAHLLEEIEGWNRLKILEPTIREIEMAFLGQENRSYDNLHDRKDQYGT